MHFGVGLFFTDYSMTPAALGKALEERGFESVWAAEHSHIPLSRRSPWPGGAELPKQYYDVMDPFVTLTAAAAATKTLKVGTGVCLVNQRDPIQTAKLVASIDQVSQGRFLFGIGIGWNAEEMEDHGTVFTTRAKLVRERVEAMKAIWTEAKPEYHGELVNFDPDDGVAQAGSEAASAGDRRGCLSAGCAPGGALRRGLDPAGRPSWNWRRVRDSAEVPCDASRGGSRRVLLPGNAVRGGGGCRRAEALPRSGIDRVTAALPPAKEDVVLPILDRWATLIRQTA